MASKQILDVLQTLLYQVSFAMENHTNASEKWWISIVQPWFQQIPRNRILVLPHLGNGVKVDFILDVIFFILICPDELFCSEAAASFGAA